MPFSLKGLLGSPELKRSLLLTLASGGNPREVRKTSLLLSERDAERERMRLEAEDRERRNALYDMQIKAAQEDQARDQLTRGTMASMATLSPENLAMYQNNPQFQANYRAAMAANGNPQLAELGGVLQPQAEPLKLTSVQQNLLAAGVRPGSPEWNQALKDYINKPRSSVTVNTGQTLPAGWEYRDPSDPSAGWKPISGGPHDPAASKEGRDESATIARSANAVDAYVAEIDATGGPTVMPGKNKLTLGAAHTNLLMEMKELYNLGVLNGPDLVLMEKVLIDPTAISTSAQGYKAEDLKDQIDAIVRPKIEQAKSRYAEKYGRPYSATPAATPTIIQRSSPAQQSIQDLVNKYAKP